MSHLTHKPLAQSSPTELSLLNEDKTNSINQIRFEFEKNFNNFTLFINFFVFVFQSTPKESFSNENVSLSLEITQLKQQLQTVKKKN